MKKKKKQFDVKGKTMATNEPQASRTPTRRRNRSKNILHKMKYGQITGVGLTHGTQVGRPGLISVVVDLKRLCSRLQTNRPQEPRGEVTAELTAN